VFGKIDLNFPLMLDTAKRIESIPVALVGQEVLPVARKLMADGRAFGPYKTPEALVAAVQQNKVTSVEATQAFIKDLKQERAFHAASPREKLKMFRANPNDIRRYLGYAPGDTVMSTFRKFGQSKTAAKINLSKQKKNTKLSAQT
jgi:hypothetical protein